MASIAGLSISFTVWYFCHPLAGGVEMTKNELMVIMYKAFNEAIAHTAGSSPAECWTNFVDRFDVAGRRYIKAQEAERNAH